MKRKLTSKTVEHLKALGPKRLDVWDTVLQGFGGARLGGGPLCRFQLKLPPPAQYLFLACHVAFRIPSICQSAQTNHSLNLQESFAIRTE
jgi:hypothetical protein